MGWSIKKPFNISAPKVTMDTGDVIDGYLGYATAGIYTTMQKGGFLGKDSYGDKVSRWSQGMWEDLTGKTARVAGEKAAKEAEAARRQAIIRQFGEKSQADSMALAGMSEKSRGGNNTAFGANQDSGFLGSGLSSSGTF